MYKILQDKKVLDVSSLELPCIIHGEQGSGASQFTISLAANLIEVGKRVLFFCAYPQGKEALLSEIASDKLNTAFIITPGDERELVQTLNKEGPSLDVIVIKNIENCSKRLLEKIFSYQNLIISGDLNVKSLYLPQAATKILFSPTKVITPTAPIPDLDKYEGFLESDSLKGIVELAI